MSSPTPVQSFLGGVGLALSVHLLMRLNGNVLGVSGFLHRAVKGDKEASSAILGIILGGVIIGLLERGRPLAAVTNFPHTLVAGFLVGLGTKLSNGCTSGHMLCGVSRLSLRSFVATITFFITAIATSNVTHRNLPAAQTFDWTLGEYGKSLLLIQAFLLVVILSFFLLAPSGQEEDTAAPSRDETRPLRQELSSPRRSFRYLAFFITSVEFALALRLSNLVDPVRVVSFLLLPHHPAFDPSLAFLAIGVLPLTTLLYRYNRGPEKAHISGHWSIPKGGEIDAKLIIGAAVFGVGWAIAGICPGPGLVNSGRAIVAGTGLAQTIGWVVAVIAGGMIT
ncbi:hypothetical protein APHAL10511_001031 [Amanita phalloides]|nr:hypothetical protein APHAL10511_001031 [Amanita phalloides]